jgi:D-alanyl-lipoteichoic acid acyltransferase DltB (MBOAT superfamily)
MTLVHILVFIAFTLLVRWLCPRHWRGWFVLLGSLLAVFWLQPSTPVRNLDFWLPAASIALTVLTWAVIRPAETSRRVPWVTGMLLIAGSFLAVGLLRYLPGLCCLTPSRPPQLIQIIVAVAVILVLFTLVIRFSPGKSWVPTAAIGLLITLFVILKSPALAGLASSGLRGVQGQSTDLATFTDLPWLGFSYLAFRLIHALRDFQANKLPPVSLKEFSVYALFYPAVTAGPIDRLQRFLPDLRGAAPGEAIEDTIQGSERIFFGIVKKFVLADSLALISMNSQNALQASSTIWIWVLLYAYAFRLYFDFSGYTDIAIGLGRLAGIRLPENFDQPYLKPDLTAFWNSWHMTLAQWFRAYFFNPLTRSLRTRYRAAPAWSVILIGQLSTMILIGLWHGITWSFFAWGAWHGSGLFIHNRWVEWRRSRSPAVESRPSASKIPSFLGCLVTFHFVLLGWVWFAMPDPSIALDVFLKLFGR